MTPWLVVPYNNRLRSTAKNNEIAQHRALAAAAKRGAARSLLAKRKNSSICERANSSLRPTSGRPLARAEGPSRFASLRGSGTLAREGRSRLSE